ncbi:MAG: putative oxidoreductase [Phycisphaerales bacterium]|nr:putative oxidoreductase [Phycisphaerales bacterium]
MINVGVIGLGMMGQTHLDVYAKRSDVKVVAISDRDPARLSGKVRAAGNVEGQAQGAFDLSQAKAYEEGMDLIKDKSVDLVDICLATPLHVEYAIAALKRGKHVLVEKPLARTAKDAQKLAKVAAKSKGLAMCAMCMRFWPGWTWLKEAVEKQTYGPVRSASFKRLATMPPGGFYANGELSGGAILDLHLHDADFVQFVFGPPAAVFSRGYSKTSGAIDHVFTQYLYEADGAAPLITAEGTWAMAAPYEFRMQYAANFDRATAVFDLLSPTPLVLYRDGQKETIPLGTALGYELEIAYFLDCIARGEPPTTVTLDDAANAIKLIEAEAKSVETGKIVRLK